MTPFCQPVSRACQCFRRKHRLSRRNAMSMKRTFYLSVAVVSLAGLLAGAPARLSAQSAPAVDNDDIGGVVTGPNGPEAGVWVIVETTDLGTKLAKMEVTDEQG